MVYHSKVGRFPICHFFHLLFNAQAGTFGVRAPRLFHDKRTAVINGSDPRKTAAADCGCRLPEWLSEKASNVDPKFIPVQGIILAGFDMFLVSAADNWNVHVFALVWLSQIP